MGKVIQQKIKGMNIWAKVGLVTTITLLISVFMYQGWYKPKGSEAAITPGTWTTVNDTNPGTPSLANVSSTLTYAAPAGTNRVLLVLINANASGAGSETGVASGNFTVQFGDATNGWVTVNKIIATDDGLANRNSMFLGYILDSNVPSSARSVRVNYTAITGSTNITSLKIRVATYTGVDQSTPIAGTPTYQAALGSSGAVTTTAPINVGSYAAGDQPIFAVGMNATTTGISYNNAAYTLANTDLLSNGTGSLHVCDRTQPTGTGTDTGVTCSFTGNNVRPSSLSAVLKVAPTTTAPTLTTPTAAAIGSTTATLGANVTADGGAAITARGTVWDTAAAPAVNSLATSGTTGVFTQARTGLTAGTKIYYRGYATNSAGTAYSPDGSFYTEPATQASGLTFTGVGPTGMTVNWTRGSGDGVIVLMKASSAVNSNPVDGTYTGYTANTAFGSGTQLGTGNYVVYKSTGTSVAVTGLSAGTTYHVAVYEYAGTVNTAGVNQGTNYLLTPVIGSQVAVVPPPPTVTAATPNNQTQGTGPTTVTITGTGLQAGAVVTFSGTGVTAGASSFGSATSITVPVTVTAGAATGARNITVTNPDTLSGTLTGGFTVNTGVCVRSAPTVSLGSAGSVIPGSSLAYVVSITNNDTAFAGCLPTSTFALTLSDTNGTDFTIPSTLSLASIAVAPGATGTVTLTVTAKAAATVGNTNLTTVTATDSANHAGQPGSGNVITTAVSSWINNNLLHNSDNLQSLKRGGAWGKPGTYLGAITCSTCHSPAKSGNIGRIRTSISAPDGSFTNRPVTFTTHSGASTSFGDDSGGARTSSFRICEVCHTSDGNSSYNQSSNGTYVHAYNQGAARQHYNNNDCTRCHGHEWAFEGESRGGRSCGPCHRTTYLSMQSKSGYHHYIYNSYTGYPNAAPTNDTQKVCLQCHVDHNIFRPEVNPANTGALGGRAANLRVDIVGTDPVKGTTTPGTGSNQYVRTDFVGNATNGGICTSCHKTAMTKSTNQQSSSTTITPVIDVAAYNASMHDYSAPSKKFKDGSQFKANCSKCHNAQNNEPSPNFTDVATHDSSNRSLLGALGGTSYSTYAGNFCYRCHSQIDDAIGGTKKTANRNDWYGAFTNMSTRSTVIYKTVNKTYKHPVSNYTTSRHKPVETAAADFSGTNRHVTCNDCHNPHAVTRANAISGTSGINPTNSTAGAAPASYSMVTVTDPDHQYKVCFKCHTDWAGYGTGTTNVAVDFNTANDSFHWVEKDKYAYTVNTGTGKGIWQNAQFNLTTVPTQSKTYVQVMMPRTGITHDNATLRTLSMRCSDCHGSNGADGGVTVPEGPHGSTYAKILKVPAGSPYVTWNATVMYQGGAGTIWCFNCHVNTFAGTGLSRGTNNYHTTKHNDWACQYCHLAIPHGSGGGVGAANQRKHLLKPSVYTDAVDSETSGNWNQHGSWVIPGCT